MCRVAYDAEAGTITFVDRDRGRSRCRSPAGAAKCNGSPTGRCAGPRSASTTRCRQGPDQFRQPLPRSAGARRRAAGRFNFELFLDENGQKISKSKGNGLTIDEWLRYASPESLSLFMYREPKSAKRLYFDVIPRNVDEYQQFLDGYPRQDGRQQLHNPVWHIHAGHPPKADMPVTFQLLLTLVSSSNAENAATLWGFIGRYRPGRHAADPSEARRHGRLRHQLLSRLRGADQAIPRADATPSAPRCRICAMRCRSCRRTSSAEDIQNVVYEIGRREPFLDA